MGWNIRITEEAKKDYSRLEGSVRKQVLAGILKVSKAPLPSPNGYEKYGDDIFADIFGGFL